MKEKTVRGYPVVAGPSLEKSVTASSSSSLAFCLLPANLGEQGIERKSREG